MTRLPAAQGRPQRAAESAADRFLVRRLSRRHRAGAHRRRRTEKGSEDPHDGGRRRLSGGARRRLHAQAGAGRCSWSRRSRISSPPQIKQVADTQVGDTITDERKRHGRRPARLQAGAAGGVLRPVPGRCRACSRICAKPWRKLASQRCQLHLRNRNLRRAGLRFPLRLSWAFCIWKSCASGWSANSIST